MKVNLPLYKDLLEDKRLNLITQINTTKNFINLYKDWRTGSKMQQITRKKSFDRNKEKLDLLKNQLYLIETALTDFEVKK